MAKLGLGFITKGNTVHDSRSSIETEHLQHLWLNVHICTVEAGITELGRCQHVGHSTVLKQNISRDHCTHVMGSTEDGRLAEGADRDKTSIEQAKVVWP
jgi:hypothetical protein